MWETIGLIAGLSVISGLLAFFVSRRHLDKDGEAVARKLLQKLKELEEHEKSPGSGH